MDRIVKYESEDEIFGPSTVTEVVRPDVFMLLPDPDDEDSRYVTQFGKIEFELQLLLLLILHLGINDIERE
jgi:hypothetical protein